MTSIKSIDIKKWCYFNSNRSRVFLDERTGDFDLFHNGSCTSLVNGNGLFHEVKVEHCFNKGWIICETDLANRWTAINKIERLDLIDFVSGYKSSLNSKSSCIAFCSSKDNVKFIILEENNCLCAKGKITYQLQTNISKKFLKIIGLEK